MRGEGHGWQVFAAVLCLLDQLGDLISDTGSKAAIQWSVAIGVVASKEVAGFDEQLGDDVLEVVVYVVVQVCLS